MYKVKVDNCTVDMTIVLVSKCMGINSSVFMMCKTLFIFFVLFLILDYFLGNLLFIFKR